MKRERLSGSSAARSPSSRTSPPTCLQIAGCGKAGSKRLSVGMGALAAQQRATHAATSKQLGHSTAQQQRQMEPRLAAPPSRPATLDAHRRTCRQVRDTGSRSGQSRQIMRVRTAAAAAGSRASGSSSLPRLAAAAVRLWRSTYRPHGWPSPMRPKYMAGPMASRSNARFMPHMGNSVPWRWRLWRAEGSVREES